MLRLALFDLDGTLIGGRDHLNAISLHAGIETALGLPEADPDDVPHAGFTDRATLLALAVHHGLTPDEAQDRVGEALTIKDQVLAHLLAEDEADTSIRATPGAINFVRDLVDAGVICGLVTGNTPFAARSKLARAGFAAEWFRLGGFGDVCETRVQLVKNALVQSARWLPDLRVSEVVVIGDTSLDVTSGSLNGTHTLAVMTGRGSEAELLRAKPSLLVKNLTEPDMLARLMAACRSAGARIAPRSSSRRLRASSIG